MKTPDSSAIRQRILLKLKTLEPKLLREDTPLGNRAKLQFFGVESGDGVDTRIMVAERDALYNDWLLLLSGQVVTPTEAAKHQSTPIPPEIGELNEKIQEYQELCEAILAQLDQMKTAQSALLREGKLAAIATSIMGANVDEPVYSQATFQVVDLKGLSKPRVVEGFPALAEVLGISESTCRVYISQSRGHPYTRKVGFTRLSVTRIDK